MMRSWIVFVTTVYGFILVSPLNASETDNYSAWKVEIQDSTKQANAVFNDLLDRVSIQLHQTQEQTSTRCSDLTDLFFKKVKKIRNRTGANWTPLHSDRYPRSLRDVKRFMLEQSIYRFAPLTDPIHHMHLAPTIHLNGVYLGVDKISHFALIGHRYYNEYQRQLSFERQNRTPIEEARIRAQTAAIDWGVQSERGNLGLIWIAFSYADLEANFQGLQFYLNFCEGTDPYFIKTTQGKWERTGRQFDWSDYVNSAWDESYNANSFLGNKWPYVLRAQRDYCASLLDPWVVEQRSKYQNRFKKSFSKQWLELQEKLGLTPPQHEIAKICSS